MGAADQRLIAADMGFDATGMQTALRHTNGLDYVWATKLESTVFTACGTMPNHRFLSMANSTPTWRRTITRKNQAPLTPRRGDIQGADPEAVERHAAPSAGGDRLTWTKTAQTIA